MSLSALLRRSRSSSIRYLTTSTKESSAITESGGVLGKLDEIRDVLVETQRGNYTLSIASCALAGASCILGGCVVYDVYDQRSIKQKQRSRKVVESEALIRATESASTTSRFAAIATESTLRAVSVFEAMAMNLTVSLRMKSGNEED